MNEISEPPADDISETSDVDAPAESATAAESSDRSALLDAEARTAAARQQILLDSNAAFAAHAHVDSYAALALLG